MLCSVFAMAFDRCLIKDYLLTYLLRDRECSKDHHSDFGGDTGEAPDAGFLNADPQILAMLIADSWLFMGCM